MESARTARTPLHDVVLGPVPSRHTGRPRVLRGLRIANRAGSNDERVGRAIAQTLAVVGEHQTDRGGERRLEEREIDVIDGVANECPGKAAGPESRLDRAQAQQPLAGSDTVSPLDEHLHDTEDKQRGHEDEHEFGEHGDHLDQALFLRRKARSRCKRWCSSDGSVQPLLN